MAHRTVYLCDACGGKFAGNERVLSLGDSSRTYEFHFTCFERMTPHEMARKLELSTVHLYGSQLLDYGSDYD